MLKKLMILSAAAILFHAAPVQADPSYSVEDLLNPCKEGDNDSRGGAVLELECEQYIAGFTDVYVKKGLDKADKVCLPTSGNRDDEVRWAFMRWAHDNFGDRKQPAVDGLLKTVRAHFPCK